MFGLLSIVWFVPVLFVLVVSARSIWLCVTRPKRWRGEPACERCGYTVTGLVTFGCPECGSDLRRTGIITPAMELRRRGSLVGACIGWTFTILAVSVIGISSWYTHFGMQIAAKSRASASTTTTLIETFIPSSESFAMFRMYTAESTGSAVQRSVAIQFTGPDGETSNLVAMHSLGTWTFYSPQETGVDFSLINMVTAKEMGMLMAAAGILPDGPDAAKQLDEVVQLFTEKITSPLSPPVPSSLTLSALQVQPASTTVTTGPAVGILDYLELIIGVLTAIVLWVGGLILIVSMRRSLLRLAAGFEHASAEALSRASG